MVTPQTTMETETDTNSSEYHALANKWTMWAHLPHDTDWSISSYKPTGIFVTHFLFLIVSAVPVVEA